MSELPMKNGRHFVQLDTGPVTNWPDYSVSLPGAEIPGKLFIKDMMGLTGCEISINSMPPGGEIPFNHTHQQNEEVYVFIKGQGQLLIDGEILEVSEGSIVRIDPEAVRSWRNPSDEQLVYLIMQVKQNSLEQYSLDDGVITEDAPGW